MAPQQITTKTGEEFEVRLTAAATAGYRWQIQDLPEGIRLETPTPDVIPGDRPGAPAIEIFRFRAEKPGDYSITFVHKRSWETTVASTQTVKVSVE